MRRRILGTLAALIALASLALAQSALASISDQEELIRFGSFGTAAGQLDLPWGLASDATTGHLSVAGQGNDNRVDEFTPWGKFVKAFGWDVAPGAVNEQQEVRIQAASGQFKLSLGAESTGDLALGASAGEVKAALEGLAAIGAGNVAVEAVPGTFTGATPFIYVVVFKGALAGTDAAQLEAVNGAIPLSGGAPSPSLLVRTRADGHAATTGLEACTEESGCKAGTAGGGAGQFALPRGAAVDAAGNVYVREVTNHRVQKFDSAGRFVLTFGGEVDATDSGNVCTKASGHTCQEGTVGSGPGQFGAGLSGGIALCSGALYVADKERIQRFSLEGAFEAALPEPGKTVQRLACDPAHAGSIYATFEPEGGVRRLNATTGVEEVKVEVEGLGAIATDAAGNLFANSEDKVLEFGPGGAPLVPPSCCEASPFGIDGLATNIAGTLYVSYATPSVASFIRAFGPGPVQFESPPPVAPEISAQFATAVGRDKASVGAEINPHFFTDTRYFVQYGTGECRSGGCDKEAPLPPGDLLTSKATSSAVKSGAVALEGLQPGTVYHYRFVAQSSGGGPVYGIDPDGKGPEEATPTAGGEASFTTFPAALPVKACANDPLRIAPGTLLPDCRAYEMVSPVDKNGGDIKTVLDLTDFTTSLSQSAPDGARFTYSAYRSFANPEAAVYANQYLAGRDPVSGWSSQALDPPQFAHLEANATDNHYKLFSPDLCQSWVMVKAEPTLAPGAPADIRELYRRENCAAKSYEALIQDEPAGNRNAFFPILQGATGDGSAAVFMAMDKLTPEAAAGPWQAYYASEGQLQLLCIGPNGLPTGGYCSAGTSGAGTIALPGLPALERFSSLTHAISEDGSKVYWTDSGANESGPGQVYLRENPGAEPGVGGACEPGKACTVKVSGTETTKAARFLAATPDGSRALYQITEGASAGKLLRFTVGSGSSAIAGKVLGVAGHSDDLSRVYFVSEEAIAGTTGAIAGKPNLYLDEEGTKTFIGTGADLGSGASSVPIFHTAQATPDGRVLTFISTQSLSGYDNTDQQSGKADSEVYVYEAGAPGPVCVSCNPSGARPLGRASLPTPDTSLYAPHILSADGSRLFFDSYDALLPRDTNAAQDVYEWESAHSQTACEEKGAELFIAALVGCLSLISSGRSPQDSELLDASADGDDVFFTTNESLLPRDPGLIDVYDARVNGGIAEPPPPPPACQGEGCQPPGAAPPSAPNPSSATFLGPEDEKPKPHHKKKHKKKKHKKKKANNHKGARR